MLLLPVWFMDTQAQVFAICSCTLRVKVETGCQVRFIGALFEMVSTRCETRLDSTLALCRLGTCTLPYGKTTICELSSEQLSPLPPTLSYSPRSSSFFLPVFSRLAMLQCVWRPQCVVVV